MIDESYDLRTPEQVELAYDLAGLGSRGLARLLDGLIQGVLIVAAGFGFGLGSVMLASAGQRWFGPAAPGFTTTYAPGANRAITDSTAGVRGMLMGKCTRRSSTPNGASSARPLSMTWEAEPGSGVSV